MKGKLHELSLNQGNSIVIGSGILEALGIRPSKDIDMVTSESAYNKIKESGNFSIRMIKDKKEVLTDGLFEIGTSWEVLNKRYDLEDLKGDSVTINGVRYLSLDFLYKVKNSWLKEGTARPKDIADLKLIEEYKKHIKGN